VSEDNLAEETFAAETPVENESAEDGAAGSQPPAAERTGHAGVDEVLESLDSLDDVPVNEQVAVFEAAHEKLRAALADAGNEPDA